MIITHDFLKVHTLYQWLYLIQQYLFLPQYVVLEVQDLYSLYPSKSKYDRIRLFKAIHEEKVRDNWGKIEKSTKVLINEKKSELTWLHLIFIFGLEQKDPCVSALEWELIKVS